MKKSVDDIDEYIAAAASDAQPILRNIRQLVRKQAPSAIEMISYRMPAFKQGRMFIYFAAFKTHIGIFPPVRNDKALIKELADYRGDKGNLKFPLDTPMPYSLIKKVIAALHKELATTAVKGKLVKDEQESRVVDTM